MTSSQALFLEAVGAALKNEYVSWEQEIPPEDWEGLFSLAEEHRMLPMVYQAVYRCDAARRTDPAVLSRYRLYTLQMAALQVRKTVEFLRVLEGLKKAGLKVLVVKGITCRNLYPNPDFRLSSDEDLLVAPEDFSRCCEVLTELGYRGEEGKVDAYEVTFRHSREPVLLELHRSLFPPEQKAYGDLNRFFEGVSSRWVIQEGIPTLDPTDHVLYLLCHSYKHFLHSGFGLRQVCDLILYANRYGSRVDWQRVLECCRQARAEKFAAGLFRIGWKYLGFSLEQSRYPVAWQAIYVEETWLLTDILQAGVYGSADRNRVHSSNLTLGALTGRKDSGSSLLQTVFPSQQDLEKRYPYVKNRPLLLPIAWTERILRYSKSSADVSGTLRIAQERIGLLKKYGILDEDI